MNTDQWKLPTVDARRGCPGVLGTDGNPAVAINAMYCWVPTREPIGPAASSEFRQTQKLQGIGVLLQKLCKAKIWSASPT